MDVSREAEPLYRSILEIPGAKDLLASVTDINHIHDGEGTEKISADGAMRSIVMFLLNLREAMKPVMKHGAEVEGQNEEAFARFQSMFDIVRKNARRQNG